MASVLKEWGDLNKLEKEVNEALQKAEEGNFLPKYISIASIPLPDTPLARNTTAYANASLAPAVFQHSFRSYYFGTAIANNFQDFKWDPDTAYLAAMLHDVGLTSHAIHQTSLSFMFHGGIVARDFLLREGASAHLSDSVAEAIMRHVDDITTGASSGHSPEGLILIFGTHLDVYGQFAPLIHADNVAETVEKYPRRENNFKAVFADLVEEEVRVKRYCVTVGNLLSGITDKILNNPVFEKYDE